MYLSLLADTGGHCSGDVKLAVSTQSISLTENDQLTLVFNEKELLDVGIETVAHLRIRVKLAMSVRGEV